MKSVRIQFNFDDEFYEELSELAQDLNISIPKLISEFVEEGMASGWDAFEYEARKNFQPAWRQNMESDKKWGR